MAQTTDLIGILSDTLTALSEATDKRDAVLALAVKAEETKMTVNQVDGCLYFTRG